MSYFLRCAIPNKIPILVTAAAMIDNDYWLAIS